MAMIASSADAQPTGKAVTVRDETASHTSGQAENAMAVKTAASGKLDEVIRGWSQSRQLCSVMAALGDCWWLSTSLRGWLVGGE
jgi:hypothetical protein